MQNYKTAFGLTMAIASATALTQCRAVTPPSWAAERVDISNFGSPNGIKEKEDADLAEPGTAVFEVPYDETDKADLDPDGGDLVVTYPKLGQTQTFAAKLIKDEPQQTGVNQAMVRRLTYEVQSEPVWAAIVPPVGG